MKRFQCPSSPLSFVPPSCSLGLINYTSVRFSRQKNPNSNSPLHSTSRSTSSSSSSCSSQAIKISELYEKAEQDLQIPIAKLLLMKRMKQNQHGQIQNNLPVSLVTSAVLATPSSCSCDDVCTCPPILKFTGVNSALHKQIHNVNNSSANREISDRQPSLQSLAPFVIKGLLKGCAEQNALGAFAASGNHFEQVRGIVICSLILNNYGNGVHDLSAREGKNDNNNNNCCCCFPCSACRNYLDKVHRDFVAKRHKNQILKLSCISLKLDDGDETAKDQQKAKQTVSLDCMEGWNTSYREEILRI